MPGKHIDPARRQKYHDLRLTGWSQAQASRKVGVSQSWAKGEDKRIEQLKIRTRRGGGEDKGANDGRGEERFPGPITYEDLKPEAKRGLEDFGYFRRRYFGRISSPWQEDAAVKILEKLETPQKEFVVVNCPPGSGKSVLFAHDIPAWLTIKRRSIRGLIGSRTARQGTLYTGRLRQTFGRVKPVKADVELLKKGRAVDAVATLAGDYGLLKPENPDIWRREEFTVAQFEEITTDEKEPTWAAFGMDSGSLGYRLNFIVWDDLVDHSTIRTPEQREKQQGWWAEEGETRLEPDGVLVLQGQRLSADDLYRHALDKPSDEEGRPKYFHIVYKAHYEDVCEEVHGRDETEPYPKGCLLDPDRLPWRELAQIKRDSATKFEVVYQQEDVDPEHVLVQQAWIDGGKDSNGVDAPGCLDKERGLWELPRGLVPPVIVFATADPSPTKYWAIEAWAYHPASEQRFLLDLMRTKMDAADFLDWDYNNNRFSGVMEEWQALSRQRGFPIRYWIVEANAAQRFILQYDHVRRWIAQNSVQVIPHQTHRNKSDPELGIQTIAPHYQFGRVRLPMKFPAHNASKKLIAEVTRYPDGPTDDCVLAHWFFEWNVPRLGRPRNTPKRLWRPSWMLPPKDRQPVHA